MDEQELLANRFESHRTHLRAVAYRMLGSVGEADDAVQEAWIRLSHSGADGVESLGAWLTTVVARVCLDMLRSRTARREEPLGVEAPEATPSRPGGDHDPEHEAVLADAVGVALLVVLHTRQREIVDAFLAAARGGDFDALLALLDPDVVLRADTATVQGGAAASVVRGAAAVAETFAGRARAA